MRPVVAPHVEGAERSLVEVERLAAELRQPFYSWFAHMGRTTLAIMRGAADAKARVFATLEEGAAGGQADAAAAFGAQLCKVLHDQGWLVEIAGATRAEVETMPHLPAWQAALAQLFSEMDQLAQARAEIHILRRNGFEHPLNWTWAAHIVNLSEAISDLGDVSAAAVLYEPLRPIAGQVSMLVLIITCTGSFALWCGMAHEIVRFDRIEERVRS